MFVAGGCCAEGKKVVEIWRFSVGNLVEAVDQVGIWSSGTVVSVENGETTVHFTGYASRYDRQIRDPKARFTRSGRTWKAEKKKR